MTGQTFGWTRTRVSKGLYVPVWLVADAVTVHTFPTFAEAIHYADQKTRAEARERLTKRLKPYINLEESK